MIAWLAAGLIGSALIGAGGSYLASRSASKAADVGAESAEKAIENEYRMFRESMEAVAPWREAGERALGTAEEMIEAGPGEFVPEEQPGYKFGYKEFVEKPLLAQASAGGRLGSGRTLKALSRYAADYASTEYDKFLGRYYQSLNPYMSLAGMGQVSAGQSASTALSTGQSISQNIMAGGQARASGYLQQGNIWGSTAGQMGQNVLDLAIMKKMGVI